MKKNIRSIPIIESTKSKSIENFMKRGKFRKFQIMYHITSSKNAKSILKNGFDLTLSKSFAFGRGVNLTPAIDHLKEYYSNQKNTVIVCMVKYNKLKYNSPYYNDFFSEESKAYFKKHEYSRPKYMNIPPGYDGFHWGREIRVMRKKLVKPLIAIKM